MTKLSNRMLCLVARTCNSRVLQDKMQTSACPLSQPVGYRPFRREKETVGVGWSPCKLHNMDLPCPRSAFMDLAAKGWSSSSKVLPGLFEA